MKYLTKRVYSLKDIAMKMMKTAIVTASVLASASIFAQSAGVNAGASAQVNVQPVVLLVA